jgi:hypothetical protein
LDQLLCPRSFLLIFFTWAPISVLLVERVHSRASRPSMAVFRWWWVLKIIVAVRAAFVLDQKIASYRSSICWQRQWDWWGGMKSGKSLSRSWYLPGFDAERWALFSDSVHPEIMVLESRNKVAAAIGTIKWAELMLYIYFSLALFQIYSLYISLSLLNINPDLNIRLHPGKRHKRVW